MPIKIGQFAFVGSNVVVVAGAQIPDFCVVAAGAVVTRGKIEPRSLIGGTPARTIRSGLTGKYFERESGFVA
jgi:maltose O-acetyltransferase